MENAITLSWTAIGLATGAYFIFGFLWYTPLFGKAWAGEMGFSKDEKPTAGLMIRGMFINLIGCFLTAYVLTHDIQAWALVADVQDLSLNQRGIMNAFFVWLGFYLPTDLNLIAWEGRSTKLFLINTVYHLLGLLIVALILINF